MIFWICEGIGVLGVRASELFSLSGSEASAR